VKTDGSNAVQLLLFIGGISLVPALLFTVTGFTRILIVLSFIRTGLGTPTAPPNQVLVGIAFFLTLLIIDLVVSATLMSMGMMMLPPVFISLPFKILLFILVDGWNLVTSSLVQSFNMS
jgi:flagellar biosynthesis protein FliP